MKKSVRKGLFLKGEKLGTVKKETLGLKAKENLAKSQEAIVNSHHPLLLLLHLLCCGCYQCKVCRRKGRKSDINVSLLSVPERMSPVPSSFTSLTSENLQQMSTKISTPATIYHSSFNSDSKQRCKFFILILKEKKSFSLKLFNFSFKIKLFSELLCLQTFFGKRIFQIFRRKVLKVTFFKDKFLEIFSMLFFRIFDQSTFFLIKLITKLERLCTFYMN